MADVVFIPFKKELYDDLVRYSDGTIDPAYVAVEQVENWIERSFGWGDPDLMPDETFGNLFGDRLVEFAQKYAPRWFEAVSKRELEGIEDYLETIRPLVWKEVTIPAGSDVRMIYRGQQHYGVVKNGYIVDDAGEFSPSAWVAKITNTARNAWRDLWFKLPDSREWVPAQLLRQRARRALQDVEESSDAQA